MSLMSKADKVRLYPDLSGAEAAAKASVSIAYVYNVRTTDRKRAQKVKAAARKTGKVAAEAPAPVIEGKVVTTFPAVEDKLMTREEKDALLEDTRRIVDGHTANESRLLDMVRIVGFHRAMHVIGREHARLARAVGLGGVTP